MISSCDIKKMLGGVSYPDILVFDIGNEVKPAGIFWILPLFQWKV
jgi:hypothetical protein